VLFRSIVLKDCLDKRSRY